MKRLGKKDRRAFAAIRATLVMLQDDALDPRLGSHKLKGNLAGLWACSAGYDLRIEFEIAQRNDKRSFCLCRWAHTMKSTDRRSGQRDNQTLQRTGRASWSL